MQGGKSMARATGLLFRGLFVLCILLVSRLAAQEAGNGSTATEKITVHTVDGNGPADLVSNALPLKPGVLFDPADIRVLDGREEMPLATQVLAYWDHDRSIRSVLIQFEAKFRGKDKSYRLQLGLPRSTPDRTVTPVTWNLPAKVFTLSAEYLSESLFAWEQKPLGKTGFQDWDRKQERGYATIEKPPDPSTQCPVDDQYYDTTSTNYQLYARTGDLRYLVNGRSWALHHRQDQIWQSGPNVGRSKCTAYGNSVLITYVPALVMDYFLFGDEESKRVAGLIVDNFYLPFPDLRFYKAPKARGFWTERDAGFVLQGILAYYEATNDLAYLREAKRRIQMLHRMQVENGRRAWVHNLYDHDPEEGCKPTDWGSSPWMSGLLLEAIVKYHKLTRDPIAMESITMALDDLMSNYLATEGKYAGKSFMYLGCSEYTYGTPDTDSLIAHAYGYGYAITKKAEYLKVGTDLMNTSVAGSYLYSSKHYNQQFRSTGHFVAYVSPDYTVPPVAVNRENGD